MPHRVNSNIRPGEAQNTLQFDDCDNRRKEHKHIKTCENDDWLDMRKLQSVSSWSSVRSTPNASSYTSAVPIIQIQNGTFYRSHPTSAGDKVNIPMFPGLSFSLPSFTSKPQNWAILGASSSGKTTLLQIFRGNYICVPPLARTFPFLSSLDIQHKGNKMINPTSAIQYIGFDGEGGGIGRLGTRGAYLSARYESHREETDFSVLDFLQDNTHLNLSEVCETASNLDRLDKVIEDFRLGALIKMPMGNLSNGQLRRARIAKAVLRKPEVLLLDEPFMGLDPPTLTTLSSLLQKLAIISSPRIVLSLRPQDFLPDWITHLMLLGHGLQILHQGPKESVPKELIKPNMESAQSLSQIKGSHSKTKAAFSTNLSAPSIKHERELNALSRDEPPFVNDELSDTSSVKEPLVEMENVQIKYEKKILGGWTKNRIGSADDGLSWTVRRGERWGIFGPNGSGKTTLLSLICSDHPQSYSLPIKVFGRGRLPELGRPGISIFDIQARIGHSSPEIHAFFPRRLTIRQTIRNAWADTFLGTPRLTREDEDIVDSYLRWFEPELCLLRSSQTSQLNEDPFDSQRSTKWADIVRFEDVPFSSQRVALLLRAIVKKPDLVILDEAFSGMDESLRDKCMIFLAWGETRYSKYSAKNSKQELFVATPNNLDQTRVTGLTENQALICVSHLKEEVPGLVRQWLCLPDPNEGVPARFGRFHGPLEIYKNGWKEIWGLEE